MDEWEWNPLRDRGADRAFARGPLRPGQLRRGWTGGAGRWARTLTRLALVILTFATAAFVFWSILPAPNDSGRSTSAPPSIHQIRQLSTLVMTKVHVRDVVVTTIGGWTGSLRLVMVVHGDGLIGVDLMKARVAAVDHANQQVVVVLPEPGLLFARVDHQGSRVHTIRATGLWCLLSAGDGREELVTRAMRQAEGAIRQAVDTPQHRHRAREQAQISMCAVVREATGWGVEIEWDSGK